MTESQYIAYFKNLATQHKLINHDDDINRAFFYIENPDELNEFDEGLRTMSSDIAMLLTATMGEFDDAQSENHTDEINAQVYIVMRKKTDVNIREINQQCKEILLSVLARTKSDYRNNFQTRFSISKIPYQKVGAMADEWYGYTSLISFICPFGYSINSAIWADK